MTWTLAVIMAIPPIFRAGMPSQGSSAMVGNQVMIQPPGKLIENSPPRSDVANSHDQLSKSHHDISRSVDEPRSFGQLSPCSFNNGYYQTTDTLGFTIVFTIVLIGIHLIYLRIFIFMRQHRKMNPARRAPAISDNWTFFGPGAAPIISSSVSSHFQSAIFQGVATVATSGIPASSQMNFTSRGAAGVLTSNNSNGDPVSAREAIEGYHMEEKITKTTYFLTCAITLLWFPYTVVVFVSVFSSEPTTDTTFFLATFLTFFQSAVTPLVCLIMLPPVVDLACDLLKTIKCRKSRKGRPNAANNGANNPHYENLSEMVCSTV